MGNVEVVVLAPVASSAPGTGVPSHRPGLIGTLEVLRNLKRRLVPLLARRCDAPAQRGESLEEGRVGCPNLVRGVGLIAVAPSEGGTLGENERATRPLRSHVSNQAPSE